jgi:alcohol dehydrogenase (NADP+)
MSFLYFKNGDSIPKIGLGTWLSKPNEVYQAVIDAVKIGYRHIDCAFIYKNEKEIGEALMYLFENKIVERNELFITSKLWNDSHHPSEVENAIRKTQNNLQLDYLDLYLIHWPLAFKTENPKSVDDLISLETIPLESTWESMIELKNKGLTKHIGVSNFSIPKLNLLMKLSVAPEVNQIELHPYFQQKKMVEFCQNNKIIVTAYSPLGSRHLINTDKSITENSVIQTIAEKHRCTTAQVLLSWGMARNTVVIPKSVTTSRIEENFLSQTIQLDEEDLKTIEQIDKNQRNAKGLFAVMPNGYYTYENIWDE